MKNVLIKAALVGGILLSVGCSSVMSHTGGKDGTYPGTRASAEMLSDGENGWAMVQDDRPELADAVALLDAAFAASVCTDAIIALARDGEACVRNQVDLDSAKAEATRVQFDLL